VNIDAAPWKLEWSEHGEISRGGQGIVTELRSIAEPTKRAVLKQILPRWKDDPQARQRLQHEAEILSKLHELGARVPKVFDSFLKHDAGEPFLLMEFISGMRFDEWLKTKAPVKTQQAVKITKAIAETIDLCHKHKIGHRDIKPSNVILKGGDSSSPYVLDFGISFDSRQTMILTREGEMFWNEFIILPECQDLEGGHRDLRSDITALVGVFFSCLTGRPPIVLRDATDQAPHQRHGKLVAAAANTTEEGERLMWFFQRGFAFRLADRFQSLSEFTSELMRFADASSDASLDPIEQFKILSHNVEKTDRNVQLVALKRKYVELLNPIRNALGTKLDSIGSHQGSLSFGGVLLQNHLKAYLPKGDILDEPSVVNAFTVSRNHFNGTAVVVLMGIGEGMNVHLYASGYITPIQSEKLVEWSKVAVVEEADKKISERTIAAVVDNLANKLAHEIRNLILQREHKL
jgi:serine/threonine protein kinase